MFAVLAQIYNRIDSSCIEAVCASIGAKHPRDCILPALDGFSVQFSNTSRLVRKTKTTLS